MISLKSGARIRGVSTETLFAITVAHGVFLSCGMDLVLTSVTDGVHSRGSLHYKGDAFDCRTKHIVSKDLRSRVIDALASALGRDFDVVLEDDGGLNEHLHVEYQPKNRNL